MPGLGLAASIPTRRGQIALDRAIDTSPLSSPQYDGVSTSAPDIGLSWESVSDADEYVVEHRSDGGTWSEVFRGAGTATTVTVSNLDAFHEVRVKAVPEGTSSRTESPWRELALPKRPTGTGAEALAVDAARALWSAVTWDGASSDPFYRYEARFAGDQVSAFRQTLIEEGRSDTDVDYDSEGQLSPGETVTVDVRVQHETPGHEKLGIISGFWSASAQVTTFEDLSTLSLTVAENTPIAGGEEMVLHMTGLSSPHPDASYTVEYYSPDDDDPTVGPLIATDSDPSDDFEYRQVVEEEWDIPLRARLIRSPDGAEALSGNTEQIVVDLTAPPQVADLTVDDEDDTQVTLGWTNPDPDRDDLDLVELWRSTTSGFDPLAGEGTVVYSNATPTEGGAESVTDTGLTNGTTYYYRVVGTDAVGNASACPEEAATPEAETVLSPTDDAHMNRGNPDTNYGAESLVKLSDNGSSTHHREGAYAFDPTVVADPIVSATLRLYNDWTSADGVRLNLLAYENLGIDESTLTWNNWPADHEPTATPDKEWTVDTADQGSFREIDVTSLVESARQAGATITFHLYGEDKQDEHVQYASKENSTSSKHPELVIQT